MNGNSTRKRVQRTSHRLAPASVDNLDTREQHGMGLPVTQEFITNTIRTMIIVVGIICVIAAGVWAVKHAETQEVQKSDQVVQEYCSFFVHASEQICLSR